MVGDNHPQRALPVRGRPRLPGGRHRRPGPAELPPDAPPLVLAVPAGGPPGDRDVAAEIASLVLGGRDGLDVRVAYRGGLSETLVDAPGSGPAVVVPLVTGPCPRAYGDIRAILAATGATAVVTGPLGPHPLLVGALHERLAEAGLARADRIRQFSIGAAVDGIVVAAPGGAAAAQDADMTAVLLASRLAVPVVVADVDESPSVAAAVAKLRETEARRVAVAPYVIGPEADVARLRALAAEAGASCAEPLGAHAAVARLVGLRYEMALDEVYACRWQ